MLKVINVDQGSDDWKEVRRGVCTGSRFKDARDKLKTGKPSSKRLAYAFDLARERCGGASPDKYQSSAMRKGTEEEPKARIAYETETGNTVTEVGFVVTEDGRFGLSPDGLINDDGVLEIKTMVSSDTLFTALVAGDVSEYIDQCNGYLWLLGRRWVDLCLWAPDLDILKIIRITRNEDEIERLEADLIEFLAMVNQCEASLRKVITPELIDLETGEITHKQPSIALDAVAF